MWLPVLSRAKQKAQQISCMSNSKQISAAFTLYTMDYAELYPPNPDDPGVATPGHHWVPNASGANSPHVYNPDPYLDPKSCLILTYIGQNIKLFHCPADTRTGTYSGTQISLQGQKIPAVRTISLSGAVGNVCDQFWKNGGGHDQSAPRHAVNGAWLDGTHSATGGTGLWATFGKGSSFRSISASLV